LVFIIDNLFCDDLWDLSTGYEEALLQYAFRKLLMMVIFLDKAKASRLIDNDPCLFVKTSTIKVSMGFSIIRHYSVFAFSLAGKFW